MDKEKVISAVVFYLLESTQPLSTQEARAKAEAAIDIIEKQAVKNHYRAIASRTNAKKGFGSNKKLASEMGKRRWMDVKKQTREV